MTSLKNWTGQKIGKLTVTSEYKKNKEFFLEMQL